MADRRRRIQAGSEAARINNGGKNKKTMGYLPYHPKKNIGPVGFEEDDYEEEEEERESGGRVPVRFVQPVALEYGHARFLSTRDEEILREKRRAILEEARNREADADETVDDFNMYSEYEEDLAWRLRQGRK